MWYKVRWTKRDGNEEFRITEDINQAIKLKNYLLQNNVSNVDLAVVIGNNNVSPMFPTQKYRFRKIP